jgi:hypothetical protein
LAAPGFWTGLAPEEVVWENVAGGVNCNPGLAGRTIGGCCMLGVKPNWPALKT